MWRAIKNEIPIGISPLMNHSKGDFPLLFAIFAVIIPQTISISRRRLKGGMRKGYIHFLILRMLKPINAIQEKIYTGLVNITKRIISRSRWKVEVKTVCGKELSIAISEKSVSTIGFPLFCSRVPCSSFRGVSNSCPHTHLKIESSFEKPHLGHCQVIMFQPIAG